MQLINRFAGKLHSYNKKNQALLKSPRFYASTSQSDAAQQFNPQETKFEGIQATNEKAKVALRVARASGIYAKGVFGIGD